MEHDAILLPTGYDPCTGDGVSEQADLPQGDRDRLPGDSLPFFRRATLPFHGEERGA